jgi:hypothetical protein
MDIDSVAKTLTCTERVSHPCSKWWVTTTNNTNTTIPDFDNPGMDPGEEVLKRSQNILDNEEAQFYRQAISRSNAEL